MNEHNQTNKQTEHPSPNNKSEQRSVKEGALQSGHVKAISENVRKAQHTGNRSERMAAEMLATYRTVMAREVAIETSQFLKAVGPSFEVEGLVSMTSSTRRCRKVGSVMSDRSREERGSSQGRRCSSARHRMKRVDVSWGAVAGLYQSVPLRQSGWASRLGNERKRGREERGREQNGRAIKPLLQQPGASRRRIQAGRGAGGRPLRRGPRQGQWRSSQRAQGSG